VANVCPAGFPAVGHGHVLQSDERFEVALSPEAGEARLRKEFPFDESAVYRLIDIPLGDLCVDELVCFTFNLGEGALAASTLRRLVNVGRITKAGPQSDRWVFAGSRKLPGLVGRRTAERAFGKRGL
jgi:lysozyme